MSFMLTRMVDCENWSNARLLPPHFEGKWPQRSKERGQTDFMLH